MSSKTSSPFEPLLLHPVAKAVRHNTLLRGSALAVSSAFTCAPALAQDNPGNKVLEEVVVTAQKRSQSLQDVPLSVQVLDSKAIDQLNISNFDDYINYMPSVSYRSLKPGSASIYIRGISSGGDGNASGQLPSVAIYLDEQPVTSVGRNLDVHIYDVARIETLAGPQGTLFGASSQAGNLRIITNKPNPAQFEGGYDVSMDKVEDGDNGYSFEGFVNIPVSDNAAIRLVGWHDKDGGYIDNIAASRTYNVSGITIDNDPFVEKDFNEATNEGMRAALKVDLNDRWTVTPSVIYQSQETEGVWDHDPADVGDLKVQRFGPDSTEDSWTQSNITVEGAIGDMHLTYVGSYLDREVDYVNDYSSYVDYGGGFVEPYYTCYVGYFHATVNDCDDPTIVFTEDSTYKRNTHELRLQSSEAQKLRWIVGAFYEESEHDFNLEWHIPDIQPIAAIRGDNYFLTDQKRVDKETAVFGEVEYDFTDRLTGLIGARLFDNETTLEGFVGTIWWPDCCFQTADNVDVDFDDSDNILKLNLSYDIGDDDLVYVTWSEGYRRGGVNRVATVIGETYEQDFVTNYEFGWKSTFADGSLRFNGAVYFMEWDDFQFTQFDPAISLLGLTANVGQAESLGFELDASWQATNNWRLQLAYSYNDAELTEDYFRTPSDRAAGTPQAPDGTELPFVPDIQYTAISRYDFKIGSLNSYFQLDYSYTDESWNDLFLSRRQEQDSYGIVNLALGVQQDNWSIDLALRNATDERAEIYINDVDLDDRITTNRPRSISVSFSQRF